MDNVLPWKYVPQPKKDEMSLDDLYRLYLANKDSWESFVVTNKISLKNKLNSRYLISKVLAEIANYELPYNNSGNKLLPGSINTQEYLEKYFSNNQGLFLFLTFSTREIYTSEKQYISPYNGLVPLIPYAYKLYRNIPYNSWDNIELVCHRTLSEYIRYGRLLSRNWDTPTDFSNLDYFVSRYGIEANVLAKARAYIENIETAWQSIKKEILPELGDNRYLRVVALQAHFAHPVHRTKYMILDHLDYDNMPPSLLGDEELFGEIL